MAENDSRFVASASTSTVETRLRLKRFGFEKCVTTWTNCQRSERPNELEANARDHFVSPSTPILVLRADFVSEETS